MQSFLAKLDKFFKISERGSTVKTEIVAGLTTFFAMVESTGAKTLTDFSGKGIKKFALMIKNYTGLDKDKRELMLTLLLRLFDIGKDK